MTIDDTADLHDIASEIGYIHRYQEGVFEVMDEIRPQLPDGVMIGHTVGGTIPDGAVKIGTVKVRHADPPRTLYIFRRGPGRPAIGPDVHLNMPPELIDRIDDEAAARGLSRAEMIRVMTLYALSCTPSGSPRYEIDPGWSFV